MNFPALLAQVAKPIATAAAALPSLPKGAAPGAPPPIPPAPEVKTIWATHFGWLTHSLAGIFMLSAVLLIGLLAIQTTKQEGLSGTIGGRVESTYRGRLGAEEQLKRWTGIVAVAFVVCGFILSITGI